MDAVHQHTHGDVAGPEGQEVGHGVQQGPPAVEDVVHHDDGGPVQGFCVEVTAIPVRDGNGVVERCVLVEGHRQAGHGMLRDGLEGVHDAPGHDRALAVNRCDGDERRGVVVLQDLAGDALDAPLDALGIEDDGFLGGGVRAHGVPISGFPSSPCTASGLNSNSATASTWAVCGNWSTSLKASSPYPASRRAMRSRACVAGLQLT